MINVINRSEELVLQSNFEESCIRIDELRKDLEKQVREMSSVTTVLCVTLTAPLIPNLNQMQIAEVGLAISAITATMAFLARITFNQAGFEIHTGRIRKFYQMFPTVTVKDYLSDSGVSIPTYKAPRIE